MQPMLAYRFLRKISDWTMAGFYSEVHVVGQENVPEHGPLILAATHHNEIIDIAALSVTIPYRRRICYWAKSSLFKNTLSGALLRSSGSIPVHRNPNNLANNSGTAASGESASSMSSQAALFKHTSLALAKGEVVGVFPEGTSYTEPAIVRVKEGAAWAAVEYVKSVAAHATEEHGHALVIIPAAIVYTDKSQYQSRVLVRYGKPIRVDDFLAETNLEDDDGVRAVVKAITGEIYQRLKEMTINAPDWDTFNSAKMAAQLTCGTDLSVGEYVRATQSLVEFLSGPREEIRNMKRSLVKYLGLLHYTGITHSALDYIYPLPTETTSSSRPTLTTVLTATVTVICQLCRTFLHPNAIAFLPMFILHLPAYVSGWLAARLLTKRDEEESKAQFKAIFGGLGLGLSYAVVIRAIFATMRIGGGDRIRWLAELVPQVFIETMRALRQCLPEDEGFVQKWVRMVAITVGTIPILWQWHNSLVKGNLERWICLSASFKVLVGLVLPASRDIAEARLAMYSRPPPPAVNPFIKPVDANATNPPPVLATSLIRPLLAARLDAMEAVKKLKLDERREFPKEEACGHVFCLACLRNLSPSACPLCRKAFQPDRVKKLHVTAPPELDGAPAAIEAEATQLLQRIALVSGEDASSEVELVVTEVDAWLSNYAADENSHRPLRASLAALQRYKTLKERNERDHAEYRRARRELKVYQRSAHQDSKTSRAVEESLLGKIEEIRSDHAMELSRLRAEIDSLRGDVQQPYRNASNPLPPPPEPLPLDRFPAFARPGGAADTPDPLLSAVPYPAPPPRTQATTTATIPNGYPPITAFAGTSRTKFVPPAPIGRPLAAPRARHAEAPRGDEWNRRATSKEANGIKHAKEERRSHAESSRAGGGPPVDTGPASVRRVPGAGSPAPSWAHHPLVEGTRSDDERDHPRVRVNGTNGGVVNGSSEVDPRPTVDTRLASAAAYVQGYGSGYDSGLHIASGPGSFAPSSYGSDPSRSFPVEESPEQPIGGLGLMGVPRPISGTVSTPDEDATPVSRPRWLVRRNTTQAVDVERSARRSGDPPPLDVPQNGGTRRAPVQTIGVRRTVTEGALRHGVNGVDDPARHRRAVSGIVAPLAGDLESPRSETTWGTVQTVSSASLSGGSMGSLGRLVGLHNGGIRSQGSVAGESYVGREGLSDNATREEGEDETEAPVITGSSGSDGSSLGLIREEEGVHSDTRNGPRVLQDTTTHRRTASYTERNPQGSEAMQDRQVRRARRSEGTNDLHRHVSQLSIAEVLGSGDNTGRVSNAPNISSTNALSLHFDASFPTHDYQDHAVSAPSGLEIVAPTPIVGGPNIIHLWANRT